MIRTKNEQAVEFKCIRNGNGETEMRKILNGEDPHQRGRNAGQGPSVQPHDSGPRQKYR